MSEQWIYTVALAALALAAIGVAATLAQTLRVERQSSLSIEVLRGGRISVVLLWLMTLIVFPIWTWGDWTHLLWWVQLGLSGMFCSAGLFIWPTPATEPGRDAPGRIMSMLPIVLFTTVGVMPLALIQLNPDVYSHFRLTGSPLQGVVDLAAWGLGGELPDYLEPTSEAERARGMGFLPRSITVSFGASLAAAWLCIFYSVISLIGRELSGFRRSSVFVLVAGPLLLLGSLPARAAGLSFPWLQPSYFSPGSNSSCGLWRSEISVMASYGPVLATAFVLIVILCFVTWRNRSNPQS